MQARAQDFPKRGAKIQIKSFGAHEARAPNIYLVFVMFLSFTFLLKVEQFQKQKAMCV